MPQSARSPRPSATVADPQSQPGRGARIRAPLLRMCCNRQRDPFAGRIGGLEDVEADPFGGLSRGIAAHGCSVCTDPTGFSTYLPHRFPARLKTCFELRRYWCAILGLNLLIANMRVELSNRHFTAVSCGNGRKQPRSTRVLEWTQQPSNIHVCGAYVVRKWCELDAVEEKRTKVRTAHIRASPAIPFRSMEGQLHRT